MEKAFWYIAVFLKLDEVACDPAANPSDCPSNRRCEDKDGDGKSTCVCDTRFYKTNAKGHCVLGTVRLKWELFEKINTILSDVSQNLCWVGFDLFMKTLSAF